MSLKKNKGACNTEEFIQEMKQGSSNILVAVRCRPLSTKEMKISTKNLIHILDQQMVVLMDPQSAGQSEDYPNNRLKEKHYAFDIAFSPDISQTEVFEKTTKFLIEGVMNGFNATVFAYGATGAGKTFSMLGEADYPGLMFNSFEELFRSIEFLSTRKEYNVKISYLEIYNEVVKDLLTNGNENLDIREDKHRGLIVAGATEVVPNSAAQISARVREGNKRRACEATGANEVSSRSHAVLQVSVGHRDKLSGTEAQIYFGKLSLIDLAGSERAAKTKNTGIRLIEGANINKSLLALGNCINALCDAHSRNTKAYIPYRDSKLTRLLKDSLGGNCRTVMIACISPFVKNFDDTHNTLEYANRAKQIKTNVKRNELNVQVHIKNYTQVIAKLKQEVTQLRSQLITKEPGLVFNIETYMIELNNHFEREVQTRKDISQLRQQIDQLGFNLFRMQSETREGFSQITGVEDQISAKQTQIENLENTLHSLKLQREQIQKQWITVPEPFLTQLNLQMRNQILQIESIQNTDKDHQSEALIKQKDMLIDMLTDQLMLRDRLIDSTTELLRQRELEPPVLKGLRPLHQIKYHSVVSAPHSRSMIQANELSPSKIPKPAKKTSRFQLVASNVVSAKEIPPPKRAIARSNSIETGQAPMLKSPPKISEKFSSNPYVANNNLPSVRFRGNPK